MVLDKLHLYSPEAQRAMKLLALTITQKGREYLRRHAPDLQETFPLETHWSFAALPVFFFFASCEARHAIDRLDATDTVLQTIRTYCPKALDFIAYIDRETASNRTLFSDEQMIELLDGLDFWPGDAIDYAKRRLGENELGNGAVSTLDMMFWVFHTAAPWDMVEDHELTPFYHESEKLQSGLYSRFRDLQWSNPKLEDRETIILEIRKHQGNFSVNLLSPYGTFTQFGTGQGILPKPSRLFIPCKPPLFLATEIRQFEDLINSGLQKERHLQEFLESHSHFLRALGFQGFRPQVHLVRQCIDDLEEKRANLYPDFIVEDLGLSPHAIVELKKAQARMTAGPDDRQNYSSTLFSALRQLEDYWSFFQDSANRKWFAQIYGEEISNPELVLILGSQEAAEGPLQNIVHTPVINRPVRLLTYSDILKFVRCQHLIIPS